MLHLHWYCEKQSCPVREVDVRVKDYDGELVRLLEQRSPCCPVCGSALDLHGVLTREQEEERDERWSRSSVNIQMWRRDRSEFIPLPVVCDDRLPSTPDHWWDGLEAGQRAGAPRAEEGTSEAFEASAEPQAARDERATCGHDEA